MNPYRALRLTPALGSLLLLGGCIGSILGGGKPDTLYRFGAEQAAETGSPAPAAAPQRTIMLLKAGFASEIDGDRLLATHGQTTRYIKGLRWVAAAPDLFRQALERSFQTRAPDVHLAASPAGDASSLSLALAIDRFEAQYPDDAMATPPTILIEGNATLYSLADRRLVSTRHFSVQAPAARNDAAAIVAAFDHATDLYTAQLTDWAATAR